MPLFYRFYPKGANRRGARHRLMLLITLLLAVSSGMLWATIPVSAQSPGAALDFDGVDDYVTLPASLNDGFGANQITLEGWFYPTALPGANQYFMWIGEAYTSDANVKFTIYQDGANLICGFYQGGWNATPGVAVTLNGWQHVACTYDQQNIKLYVNGAVAASAAASAALPAGDGDWYLGRIWAGADYYKGRMDEVRIWNRALSASEIANRMNCEPGGDPSGLVARYSFNQGTALADNSGVTSLTDSSSNTINGTLSGFALSGSASNWVAPGSAASGVACVAAPEIDVQGNGVSIASGDSTPSSADDTDFGRAAIGSASVTHTFTIRNPGGAALTLSGSPLVAVTGSSAFSVSSQPGSSVAAGSSSTFALTFNPSDNGVFTATVSIASNDSDENPYTFVVGGIRTGSNVALGKAATQSSNSSADPCGDAVAGKAVDGNTDGNWYSCSVAQTNSENQPWWQVDLGTTYPIDLIDLWTRTDCCTDFLRNFDLSISTDGTNWQSFYYPGTATASTSFVINASARYVRVQLRDTNYLMLAEVQVWGPGQPEIDLQGNGVSIANGDSTPSAADQSAFGELLPGNVATRTFTIRNNGAAPLTLSGSPLVALNGDSAFTVSSQPAGNSLAINSSHTFTITFAPTAIGVFTATVSIANNDDGENPYTFVVGGAGVTPNAQLNGVSCLLIDAITAANSDAASGACPAGNGADTITLLRDVTLNAVYNGPNAAPAAGLPKISSAITLQGGGHTISRDSGAAPFGLLYVDNSGALTLTQTTLTGGNGDGGAIFNQGTLVVDSSTVAGNVTYSRGGGIYNLNGTLTVNNSTIANNDANGGGGGIYNDEGTLTVNNSTLTGNLANLGGGLFNDEGTLTVNNSTLTGNSATNGGGLYNAVGTLTLTNSTLTGNSATNYGGGLLNQDTLTLNNSTLTGNSADNGGGIYNFYTLTLTNSTLTGNSANLGGGIFNYDTLTLNNSTLTGNSANLGGGIFNAQGTLNLNRSLITGNGAAIDSGPEIFNSDGTVTAGNFNLIGFGNDARSSGFTPSGSDMVPTVGLAQILNSTLANNGGATQTHALVPGSPALDAAGDSGLATDQRGVTRPQGAADDIGAFELAVVAAPEIDVQGNGVSIVNGDSSPDSADHTAFGNVTVESSLQRTFTISNSGNADLTDVLVTIDGSACAAGATSCIPAGDFTLVSAPDTTIAAGDSSSFTIAFAPTAAGLVESVVSIASNDSNENPYTFAVNGNGIALTQITIVLDAVPNLPTNLGFQGSFGPFILDDPALDDSDAYTNTKSFTVAPGSYTVRRNNPAGWFTTAIVCTPDGKAVTNVAQRSAAITVAEGDNVTCTFTVERAAVINARAFNDLVRRTTNLGKRNAGDPWQTGWNMSVAITPTAPIATGVTGGSGAIPQASFINLRPGSYVVCTTLPAGSWTPTTPTANDPVYGQPCKPVTLAAGQIATVLFGAYQPTVVASEAFTPADELITDEDNVSERPYDPAEDETATDEAAGLRLFLPLIKR